MGLYGFGWGVYGQVMMLLLVGGLVAAAVWAVRAFAGSSTPRPDSALDVLDRRLAAGEISAEEHEQARRALQHSGVKP
ncbi:MAG: SHOCT domain-containing protein [bacterium]|nr:SHOCT domain-containing protein [bacterium]